jgi:hypothetical protein
VRYLSFFLVLGVVETSPSQPVVYPLEAETRWQFWYSPGSGGSPSAPLRILCDSVLPNGIHYAAVLYNPVGMVKFERKSSDSVFACEYPFQQEHLLYRFTSSKGDTVSTFSHFGWSTDVILRDTFTSTVYWGSRRMWRFLIDAREVTDDEEEVTIADSLGVVGIRDSWGYFCTLEGAVINGRVYGTVGSVLVSENLLATTFSLSQNYPNPFNPSTTIRYELPTAVMVRLSVFDVLGREVVVLVNERKNAAVYELPFTAEGLSSGMYIYRLQAGDFVQSKKLLLLK